MNITAIASLVSFAILNSFHAQAQDASATAPETEKPKWKRSAGVGATLTQGNSDTILITANLNATRKWEQHELLFNADAAYGEVEKEKNADSLRGIAQYNHLFSERFYGYARFDALHDAIADVDYRFTVGPGVGYYFIKSKTTSFSAEAGPAFIYEKVGGEEDGYLAARIGEKFEHQLTERSRIWQSAEILPQVDDFENFIAHAELGVESKLTDALNLRLVLQDIYDNQPAPGRDRNDIRLISGIAYQF